MSDWQHRIKAAEEGADQMQAAEQVAEESFRAVQARGTEEEALKSEELQAWMASRRATDAAWGQWATLMDAKPAS